MGKYNILFGKKIALFIDYEAKIGLWYSILLYNYYFLAKSVY